MSLFTRRSTPLFGVLLASSAFVAVPPAWAQTQTATTETPAATPDEKAAIGGIGEDSITVTARRAAAGGLMQRQNALAAQTTITPAFIEKQFPASNSLQLIKLTPGANVAQADAYGVTERADLSVRGYDQSQMGFVVDGMPQGDPNNYLPNTNEWIDNENIHALTITQGTTDLGTPTLSATGGLISASMRDPAREFGGLMRYSRGSFDGNRGFIRLDSGEIGKTGIRLFGSYSRVSTDDFRGYGHTDRTHFDFKALKEWDGGSRISLIYTHNRLYNERTNIPTLAQFQQFGKDFNYDAGFTYGNTNYYKFYPFYRRQDAVSLPSQFNLGNDWKLKITPYYRDIGSTGPGAVNLSVSSLYYGTARQDSTTLNVTDVRNGRFMALSQVGSSERQGGINTALSKVAGANEFTLGYWVEYLWDRNYAGFQQINFDGSVRGAYRGGVDSYLTFANGLKLSGTNYEYDRWTNVGYAQDKLSLLNDNLTIVAGVRLMNIQVDGHNYLPGPQTGVRVNQTYVMPRLGATFHFGPNREHQVFFNATTNARPPTPGPTYFDTYNVSTGARTNTGVTNTKAEYSISEELGYRYQGLFDASITLFNANLRDHQVNTIVSINGSLTQAQISAGGQTIRGVDAEVALHPYKGFAPYVSAEYLHATTDDDFQVGLNYLPTKGKVSVRSPKWQVSGGIMYDRGPLFGSITGKYVASQYATFMNDQKMPHYYTADLSLGYKLPSVGFLKEPILQLNIMNLFDRNYLGSVASPTSNAVATVGRTGATIAGSQPGYYEAATRTVMGSLSVKF